MTIRMVIGAVSRLLVFPVQHKYIRRASPLCVHKFLQIIDLQNYRPAFPWLEKPAEHVRIAINGRLTHTHSILFFNNLNFANERPENSCRLKISSNMDLDELYCATTDINLQVLK